MVWTLRALFKSPLSIDLTFTAGTSLSKVYKIINRFSEDIDLTYDVRKLIPGLIGGGSDLPARRSQADKWTKEGSTSPARLDRIEDISCPLTPIAENLIEANPARVELYPIKVDWKRSGWGAASSAVPPWASRVTAWPRGGVQ